MKKRGVLSLWKVIILVISGILGVAGVTVLSLYLMGSFEKENVEPQDMSFVRELNEGSGFYNLELGQYEVSSDFKLTIKSDTENVSQKRVVLSLRNGQAKDGYITDGIIRLPQIVELNKAFSVTLQPEYNSELLEDWIVGGNSYLTAKSANVLLPSQSVVIAVDVPVHDIKVSVTDSTNSSNQQEVVVGTSFTLDTTFTPNKSKFIFSDSTRNKEIFYAFTSSFISYNWETERFYARERSGSNVDTITAYTFANSFYQKQVMDLFSSITDREVLTSNVLRYFESHPQTYVSKSITIKVLDIDVDSVTIANSGKTMKTYLDQYFTLTANSENGNAKLGLSIKDSSGMSLNSLFGQVGIKIPKGNKNISIQGGRVVKVEKTETETIITKEDYDIRIKYEDAPENINYYLLPNTAPKEFSDYFWKFSATVAGDVNLDINFFYENDNGILTNFFAFEKAASGSEKNFVLSAEDHDNEENPAWLTNDTIKMLINFDENGNTISSNRDLAKDLNLIGNENVYKTVKYFLMIDTLEAGYAENLIMTNAFICSEGVIYKNDYRNNVLAIQGATAPEQGYTLYELDDSILTALKSFVGKVKIVAATIKTDAENNPYLTNDGKYEIVKVSRAKEIVVESTLSISNMDPTFSFVAGIVPNAEHGNEYYLPAVNRNESGTQKTMINMQMTLKNSENPDIDSQKVIEAFNEGKLKVVCLDRNGKDTSGYVTLQGLIQKEVTATEITFEATLTIEEGYFSAGKNSIDKGTFIKMKLQYDDGKEIFRKDIFKQDDDNNLDHFYIYYQQPIEMKGEFQNQNDLDKDGDGIVDAIEVSITASNGIIVTWGNRMIPGDTTADIIKNLNDLLTFSLKDQYNNSIDLNLGIYKIRFVETPATGTDDYLLSFDSTLSKLQNFASTQGDAKTTKLTVYLLDKDDNFVNLFDNEGNSTTDLIKSQDLNFKIRSEGVSKVKYDSVLYLDKTPEYKESSDKSRVRVEKYVSSGDVVELNRLVQIYTTGSDGIEKLTDNVTFKLDNNYISSLSSKNKIDIMKMMQFNVSDTQTLAVGEEDTIENYKGKVITKFNIINPFKEDTEIMFTVRDSAETLYNISLVFVCKSDIDITIGFNTYYEQNADYLVQKDNKVGVFAGQSYDLDEFIELRSSTGKKYSWVTALGNLASLDSSPTGVFNEEQGICHLSKVEGGDGATTKILLNINDTYQFKVVNITIYFGINSFYACSQTFSLYVNPNLVVREVVGSSVDETPFVNLQDVSSGIAKLNTTYQLYKLTDYITNGYTFDGCVPLESSNVTNNIAFTYENLTTNKYIGIKQSGSDFVFTFVKDSTLNLNLGDKTNQTFKIMAQKIGVDSVPARIDAVKIVEANQEKKIVLCDENNPLSISMDIGYGGEDAESMASNVLKRVDSENVEHEVGIVKYNKEIYLLLLPQANYNTQQGFTVRAGSTIGDLYKGDNNRLSTYEISNFVSFSNSFMAEKTIYDKDNNGLTMVVSIKAIVSKVGEKFVYYATDDTNNKYNKYNDIDFKTLISNYTELEKADVAQVLNAGSSYTVVHDSQFDLADVNDGYGFYFNGTTTNIAPAGGKSTPDSSFKISIVENAQGYVSGLASLEKAKPEDLLETKLRINHLESSQENAYIVLRFELYKYYGSVNYVWYYRIKVMPSFTVGTVTYPYTSNGAVGEYLDIYSNYYHSENKSYVVDLDENFNAQNSKYSSGKRFADLIWLNEYEDANKPEIGFVYSIKSATANGVEIAKENYESYFSYSFVRSELFIKFVDTNSKLTITLQKSYVADGVAMIGSEMQYILKFNQGSNYVHSLKKGDEKLTAKNNVYETTISAGSTEEIVFTSDIKISSNGTESKVNEYSTYISGTEEQLLNALKLKTYLVKGQKYYADVTGSETNVKVFAENIFFGEWRDEVPTFSEDGVENPTFVANSSGIISINIGDQVYYVKREAISYSFAYLDEQKKLHIKSKDNINEDNSFEIGYYTDEKVVLKIKLTVTSFYNWSLNTSNVFKGGKKYNILTSENSLFTNLESKKEDVTIKDFNISLKNGDADYIEGVKISDLVNIENDVEVEGVFDWRNSTIEFAHLANGDATFTFEGIITASDDDTNTYAFTFDVIVKSSFDTTKTRRYPDTASRYGTVKFVISIDRIQKPFESDFAAAGETEYFYALKNDQDIETTDSIEVEETPENVGVSTSVERTYIVVNKFKGKEIFRVNVLYRYTILPNVELKTNYPNPSASETTALKKEYISTDVADAGQTEVQYISEIENSFFSSPSMFSTEKRVVANSIAKDQDNTSVVVNQIWNINVASISNAVLYASGSVSKTILTTSSDMMLLKDSGVAEVAGLNLKFGLVNSASNGIIIFDITVNNVATTYSIEIVKGSVIKTSTNSPNYTGNRETIYAEDLSSQTEKNLFGQYRILNYSLKSSVVLNTKYFLRYVNKSTNEVQVISLTANNLNQIVNIDLGKSYKGFEYQGTFNSLNGAENNTENNKMDDAGLYLSAPVLTSREVLYYYDNTVITLKDGVDLLLVYTENDVKKVAFADNFSLTKEDYGIEKKLSIELGLGYDESNQEFSKKITTGDIYNLYLDLEFTVVGNADQSKTGEDKGYTTVDAKAGSSNTLLSYSAFGIKNSRTKQNYTQESLKNSSGTIGLEIYGFQELKVGLDNVADADKLQKVAGDIHKSLISTAGKNSEKDIVYKTGLSPRANMPINSQSAGGNLTQNYITLQGILSGGKTVDYQVFAQGSNNDGNHVMMKITYKVSLNSLDNNQTITKSHNILFRVVPNSDVQFKSKHEEVEIYNPSANEINNYQSVASNYEAYYEIPKGSLTFNLWNTKLGDSKSLVSTIKANMYGSSNNSASKFTYTYNTAGVKDGHNDLSAFNYFIFDDSSSVWTANAEKTQATFKQGVKDPEKPEESLAIWMPLLTMGTRNFVIELENDFGFKAKFYFRVTADVNPQISTMSSVLQETTDVSFGLRYQYVNPTKSTQGDSVVYNSFIYQTYLDNAETKYANTIQVTTNDSSISVDGTPVPNFKIDGARLSVTLDKDIGEGDNKVVAGSVIVKDFNGDNKNIPEPPADNKNQYDFTIWDKDRDADTAKSGWTFNENKMIIAENEQAKLIGATCVFELKVSRIASTGSEEDGDLVVNNNKIGSYTSEYLYAKDEANLDQDENHYYLLQIHTPSSNFESPNFEGIDGKTATNNVTLGGIVANAYSNNLGAVDMTSAKVSKLNSIYVKRVDYMLGDKLIGSSIAGGSTANGGKLENSVIEEEGNPENGKPDISKMAKLITNPNVSFVNESKTIDKGVVYDATTMKFTVPTINGILFGTSDRLSNVKMKVTLYSDQRDECVLEQYVTIVRNTDTTGMFEQKVVDNTSPEFKKTAANLGNDTLEIRLEPGATITLAVSDKEINKVEAETVGDIVTTKITNAFEDQKVVTLTNNKSYAVTEYVGISSHITNLANNLDFGTSGKSFYLCVKDIKDASLKYDKSSIDLGTLQKININGTEVVLGYKANKKLEQYHGILLNIENVAELNTSNYKTETLYFLYKDSGQIYQYNQNFSVYPEFETATNKDGDYYQVDNYIKMESASTSYYVLRLNDWANKIALKSYASATAGSDRLSTNSYKYYYSINTNDSETEEGLTSGSAFVDENGMITTNSDFDIKYHTITINVFMKVSGPNATYETTNSRLKLGSFRIYLKFYDGSSDAEKLTEIKSAVDTNKVYTIGNDIISVPANYKVLYTLSSLSMTEKTDATATELMFASAVGEKLDLNKMFGNFKYTDNTTPSNNFDLSTVTNKNYHLVEYTVNGTSYGVSFNNLNSWKFDTVGTYTFKIMVTGRENNVTVQKMITSSIIVYETSTKEEQQQDLIVGGSDTHSPEGVSDELKETWYLLHEDKTITEELSYTSDTAGIYTNTYIVKNDKTGKTKIINKKYFVYEDTISKKVAIKPLSTFYLSNLVEVEEGATYDYYRISGKTITKLTTVSFSQGENSAFDEEYIIVTKKGGVATSIKKYEVNYKMISTAINQEFVYINADDTLEPKEDFSTTALAKIKTTLNFKDGENIIIQNYKSTGLLSNNEKEYPDSNKNLENKQYLVTYTNSKNVTTFHRFDFTFYIYKNSFNVDYVTAANSAFNLSELNSLVTAQVGASSGVSVSYYELSGKSLNKVDVIPLESNVDKQYYVKVGNDYYYFTFKFYVYSGVQTIDVSTVKNDNFELASLNNDVISKVGEVEGVSVEYFEIKNNVLTKMTAISVQESSVKTYYVKVKNLYYQINFNITITTK